jgi:hypothetical protein
MTMTSLADVAAGQQYPRHLAAKSFSFNAVGMGSNWPASASENATLNGVTLTNPITGSLPFSDPNAGNAYLSLLEGRSAFSARPEAPSTRFIADRLWHNGGYTITSAVAQNSTTPTWPARDIKGATNGDGVFLGLEIGATVGAATPTITVSYTNSAGTAGRTGTNIFATISGAAGGTFYPISLQAGDIGVRSVQSLTLSASWLSGTINLVAYRPITCFSIPNSYIKVKEDIITLARPKMYTGSVPFLLATLGYTTAGVTANDYFTYGYTWG